MRFCADGNDTRMRRGLFIAIAVGLASACGGGEEAVTADDVQRAFGREHIPLEVARHLPGGITWLHDVDSINGDMSVLVFRDASDAKKQLSGWDTIAAALEKKHGAVRTAPLIRVANVVLSIDDGHSTDARERGARRAMKVLASSHD
jgi:hypothetical protein